MLTTLTDAQVPEKTYYARHLRLPGFNQATQNRLRKARVLIIGVGGLGCPAALYLAGAGIGTIALCDADNVSATNLHRQVLFDVRDLNQAKVTVAAARLRAINPHIVIETIPHFADADLLAELVPQYDVVLDGTDNFSAKYAINDACAAAKVPLVYGSIFQFEGQVSVFHAPTPEHPLGLSYRDLYPDAPPASLSQNCGEAGVIGVLPGIIGTMQANEVIKLVSELGEPLSGSLLIYNALTASFQKLALAPRSRSTPVSELPSEITQAEVAQLTKWRVPFLLVDVRDAEERQESSLGGKHIPLFELSQHLPELAEAIAVVVYCKSGVRSAKATLYLQSVLPNTQVFSLQGGMDGAACNRVG